MFLLDKYSQALLVCGSHCLVTLLTLVVLIIAFCKNYPGY